MASNAKLHLVSHETDVSVDLNAVFNALDMAVLVCDGEGLVINANTAAENLVGKSLEVMLGRLLTDVAPTMYDVADLAQRANAVGMVLSEHGLIVSSPTDSEQKIVDAAASPLPDTNGCVVVRMVETTVTQSLDRRLGYLGAARSVSGMASVLAHEVKNPLSGIRGASQLLDRHVSETDRSLTDLIRDEVDRICALLDRMGQFSDKTSLHPVALNIHKVLDRVHKLGETGFASHLSFVTDYDPSLPPVSGDRDMLIQVFLNLVKNAAEAAPAKGGRISLKTTYVSGVRLAAGSSGTPRRNLSLCIEVTDNGDGIPDDMKDHLFDPFVTSKPNGSGLGLALTARIIHDHGGLIDVLSSHTGTTFRVLLPVHKDGGSGEGGCGQK